MKSETMFGNEPNSPSSKEIDLDNLRKDSKRIDLSVTNTELDKYFSVDENNNRRSSDNTTQVVTFQGVDHKDSICSEVTEKQLPPIPDGGWGWVVVFAAFLTSACSDGLAYSFGNLHEEFIIYFGESQAKTSWIGSLFIAIPLISGPIMSALVERFGCRTMTMIASVVSTAGFLLAAISNSVELLCITLGVISGLAMGILYVTSVVAVAFWFDKRRTLAVSLASCGIGFGTVIYAPFTEFLLSVYDWRNTLIILSGTVLNMCICGALMRDPDWVIFKNKREVKRKKAKKAKLKKSSSMGSLSIKSMGGETVILTLDEINEMIKNGRDPEYILSMLTSALAESEELEATTHMNADSTLKKNNSTVDLPTFIHQSEQVPPEVMENIMSNKNLYNIIQQSYPHLLVHRRSDVNFVIGGQSSRNSHDSGLHPSSLVTMRPDSSEFQNEDYDEKSIGIVIDAETSQNAIRDVNNYMVYPQEKNHTEDSKESPSYRNAVVHRRALMTLPQHRLRSSSLPDIYKSSIALLGSKSENEKKWYTPIVKMLRKNFNFIMFTEFHFLMFNITSLLMSVWSIIPFFFLKSYMSEVEVTNSALVISMIGVSSGVGIVALGWFGDKPWYNVTKAYAVCLVICGASVAVFPFVITNYGLLIFDAVIFGVSFASSYSYTPAILMELVPIDHFTVGYGMILLSQGIGNLIGPPLGGFIYDLSESWDLTFFVGGGGLVIAGVCVGIIAYVKNFRIIGKAPLLLEELALKNAGGPGIV